VHRYSNGIVFFSYLMASGLDEVLNCCQLGVSGSRLLENLQ